MLLTASHNLPNLTGRVNIAQLAIVEAEHLPAPARRLASEPDLLRVAQEIAEEQPELADEALFVVNNELHRRASKMKINA